MSTNSPPADRKYLKSHEWHLPKGADVVEIGITQVAADELTDVTYVKLPAVGSTVTAGKPFGEIESVKATSDLYSGVTGTVTEINEGINNDPGVVNRDPYAGGWMIRVKVSANGPDLLALADYLKATGH